MNALKTAFLMTLLAGLFIVIGGMLGGRSGVIIAFVFAAGMNFFSYFFSDKIALSMYRAKPAARDEYPQLYEIVEYLTNQANLPMPELYVIPQDAPNAFATGRSPSHAAVAVTHGALNILTKEELMGVLGHELGHVKHRDILISTIAATAASAIMFLSGMIKWAALFGGLSRDDEDANPIVLIAMAIVAPIAAMLIQMAISRSREYDADKAGAVYSQNPLYLASALEKLEDYSSKIKLKGSPATENMFIVNPFKGKNLLSLFATHPPTSERIKRLKAMA